MLKPEIARRQLEPLRSKNHSTARLLRLKKLPRSLAAAGLGALGLVEKGREFKDWRGRGRLLVQSAADLAKDAKGRAKVFAALYPTVADILELGWQAVGRLTYTVGHNRRPFRAPGRPELFASRRLAYLSGLHGSISQFADDTLTAEWLATWAVHLGGHDQFGYLFAGIVDADGSDVDALIGILKDSAANRHEIGGPGRHAVRALLCCNRPDAWEFVEKLLLAAQRQEGLRQSILEASDEAQPGAFRQLVGVLLEHDLTRFAAVARAVGVWIGEQQAVENPKKLKADLQGIHDLLGDAAARQKTIAKGDAASAYRGLWATAFTDVGAAAAAAASMLKDRDAGRRFAAVKLLAEADLPETTAMLTPMLHDPDPRIVSAVLGHFAFFRYEWEDRGGLPAKLFEQLEKVIPGIPEAGQPLKSPVEGWYVADLKRSSAADLLLPCLGDRPAERLLPYLRAMTDYQRIAALAKVCEPRTLSNKVRQTLLAIAGEPLQGVRSAALQHLKKCKLAEDEARTLEGFLTSKVAAYRGGVFDLLLNRPDKLVLGSIDQLLTATNANQRTGGIELSRRMAEADRQAGSVRNRLSAFRDEKGKRLSDADAAAIAIVLDPSLEPPTLEDGLGTFDPAERTEVVPPIRRNIRFATPAAVAIVKQLDELIHENRNATFTVTHPNGTKDERVLGSIQYAWLFPVPKTDPVGSEISETMPLAELWDEWMKSRPEEARDVDGFELYRAAVLARKLIREGEEAESDDETSAETGRATAEAAKRIQPYAPVRVRYGTILGEVFDWLVKLYPVPRSADFVLDAAESALAHVPPEQIESLPRAQSDEDDSESHTIQSFMASISGRSKREDWREEGRYGNVSPFVAWLSFARRHRNVLPNWTPAHDARLYRLCRWVDEPAMGVARRRAQLDVVLKGWAAGAASRADLLDHLAGQRAKQQYGNERFDTLRLLSDPDDKAIRQCHDPVALRAAVNRVIGRIIEVELSRGETPTAASAPALNVKCITGVETLIALVAASGKGGFTQTSSWSGNLNKPNVLTHLIQVTRPLPGDTPVAISVALKAAVKSGRFDMDRVAELGLVNPRWVTHCAATLGWAGYEEAVYWFVAHTNCAWNRDLATAAAEVSEAEKQKSANPWQQIIKARTNLTPEQLAEGLIDVAWFHQAYAAVGSDKRWDAIEAAAKFLNDGRSHKKAARLADVLLGRTKKKDLVQAIRTKMLKESVRLLGLLPLPADPSKRDADLADRYGVLKDYERYARGLSALSKEPAMQAARLGMENLAVTAGYPDPMRLEWAVTAKEVADLRKGPAVVEAGGVTLSLSLNDQSELLLSQSKAGKPLKSLPAEVRKNAKIQALLDRKKSLTRMAANSKRSLEQAMCAGERFRGAELAQLAGHAIVGPMIERLVIKSANGMGYPVKNGTAIRTWADKTLSVKAGDDWTIAHPIDFIAVRDWPDWQSECFRSERLQPFKQVFRELYTLTPAEKEAGDSSERYAGQQVNETQGRALFAGRGWSTKEDISKRFPAAKLVADVTFEHGWTTPADAASPAIGRVEFHRHGDWNRVPLKDVPPIVFSEVMRDLDLVVSVAHVGGVDPEATQSTVEMRAALLRETCNLLKLVNVTLDSKHALIHGDYGRYSVHLGSGGVHKLPGGALCVVPVQAQHRGRLFLPFADDDPRTAEVVSKVLLLARDKEIQDPTILEQIARA